MKKIVLKNPDGKCNTFDVDYSEEELADKNDEGWKKLHELKTEKFQDTMAWNEFFERNKDHMMEMFKNRQGFPSHDSIILMAHYMKHFKVSSMENKEFWEFYSNKMVRKRISKLLDFIQ